jgi:hypothetical protein
MPDATIADFKKHAAGEARQRFIASRTPGQKHKAKRAKNKAAALKRKAKKKGDARIFELTRKPAPAPKDDGPNPFK